MELGILDLWVCAPFFFALPLEMSVHISVHMREQHRHVVLFCLNTV